MQLYRLIFEMKVWNEDGLQFALCYQRVYSSSENLLIVPPLLVQTSSNEVAVSHLFPPLDGSGLVQLSNRGSKVIWSCENRVAETENQRSCGLCSSLFPGHPCGIWHTLGQPDFLKQPCNIRIHMKHSSRGSELLQFVYFISSCSIISWMEEACNTFIV